MPQPFKRKGRKVRVTPAAVAERAHLGIGIAIIASHWSSLENTLSLMYAYLLFGQEESAFQFYHELIDLSLRKKAFMTAAKGKLSKELIDEIDKLYTEVRKLGTARNSVIHATWAVVDSKPDSLFLCDPKTINAKVNEVCRHVMRMATDPRTHGQTVSVDLTPEQFTEYKHRDLDGITRRIIDLDKRAMALANRVLARSLELVPKPSAQGA
jgi:hypothetical protein